LILDSICAGQSGSTSALPLGIEGLCDKMNCTVDIYFNSQVAVKPMFWYIQAGQCGCLFCVSFLLLLWGGVIPKSCEARLKDSGCAQFEGIAVGQWKFLFKVWNVDTALEYVNFVFEELHRLRIEVVGDGQPTLVCSCGAF
jgi:hypothetical protein